MDYFLRVRDSFNSKIELVNGNIVENIRARTGDKMRLSNSKGEVVNLELNSTTGYYDIFSREQTRVIKFIEFLAKGMGFRYLSNKWTWNNLNVTKFEKRSFESQESNLNAKNFNRLIEDTPFSWAITSKNNIEYTIGRP
ncbi:hypothetical protein SDC9_211011 [bioreactor metagenome]|uniref:Uncharacterized protein n=1 Tax=bioreactor metagenome TaxID=1076179 RepID=A0A645JTD9_9ZZZZ